MAIKSPHQNQKRQQHSNQPLPLPAPVLRGKATIVLDLENKSDDIQNSEESLHGQDLVIKTSWSDKTRVNEADIIKTACEQLDDNMTKHMPQLISWRDVSHSSTKKIISDCADSPRHPKNSTKPRRSRDRVLRLLVFRKLVPLSKLESVDDIVLALKHSFMCHYALWKKGIEHGDISVWNIMWDSVNHCGVLNDWDHSLIVETVDGENKERTGTIPFMARVHILRYTNNRYYHHEVECFIWVLTWLCIEGTTTGREWTTAWCNEAPRRVGGSKSVFLTMGFTRQTPGEGFENAWGTCKRLLGLLRRVDEILSDPETHGVSYPDNELLYKAFMTVMDGYTGNIHKLPLYYES